MITLKRALSMIRMSLAIIIYPQYTIVVFLFFSIIPM